ncbi:MAG: ABC transporter permease [Bacteroidales bacterium]
MKEYLKMAWRNLGRNRRRTAITTASVLFAVFFATVEQSFHLGIWHNLLENVLHSYTGYLQIHASGYQENKNFDYTFPWNEDTEKALHVSKDIKALIPRLESFALASSGERTKPVIVAGIDPGKEYGFSHLPEKLAQGKMLEPEDQGALISRRLAEYLKLKVGDTLLLISQGYAGTSAAGIFPVRGIVRLPAPEWDNQMVYLTLPTARQFYSAENMLTTLVVDLRNPSTLEKTAGKLSHTLGSHFEVLTWKQMLTELYQQYISDVGSGYILLGLLYLIIGFGIFGTLMMMLNERRYELGVMTAVGMKKRKVAVLISTEVVLLAFLGILLGIAAALPVMLWFHHHPVTLSGTMAKTMEIYGMEPEIPALLEPGFIFKQGIAVLLLTFMALVWPVISVFRLSPVKALRR